MQEFTKEMLRKIDRAELERMYLELQREMKRLKHDMRLVERGEHD